VTVGAVRDEMQRSPTIEHVTFAMRGAAAYQAFEVALADADGHDPAGQAVAGSPADGAVLR
jgi:hypothetical protein